MVDLRNLRAVYPGRTLPTTPAVLSFVRFLPDARLDTVHPLHTGSGRLEAHERGSWNDRLERVLGDAEVTEDLLPASVRLEVDGLARSEAYC
jgi:hypothetical protein